MAGPAGLGASALALQDKNYKVALQMAMDADLRGRKIHYCPKESFSSLAKESYKIEGAWTYFSFSKEVSVWP